MLDAAGQASRCLRGLSVLVHCHVGQDRTGFVCGAWRVIINKWPFDQIMEERARYVWTIPGLVDRAFSVRGIEMLEALGAGEKS